MLDVWAKQLDKSNKTHICNSMQIKYSQKIKLQSIYVHVLIIRDKDNSNLFTWSCLKFIIDAFSQPVKSAGDVSGMTIGLFSFICLTSTNRHFLSWNVNYIDYGKRECQFFHSEVPFIDKVFTSIFSFKKITSAAKGEKIINHRLHTLKIHTKDFYIF